MVTIARSARWIALAKPAGLSVFPRHGQPDSDCLLARLLAEHPAQDRPDWPTGFAGGIAHRLDIPTSGLVLAARSPADLVWLRGLFADKKLSKRYRLLTNRTVPWASHTISAAIAHDRRKKRRMVVQRGRNTPHRGQWLAAQTHFQHQGQRNGVGCWEARMQTGVMHQIRVHAGFAGIALAGDQLYGGGPAPAGFAARFALHHIGLQGPGLSPPQVPLPAWWARFSG